MWRKGSVDGAANIGTVEVEGWLVQEQGLSRGPREGFTRSAAFSCSVWDGCIVDAQVTRTQIVVNIQSDKWPRANSANNGGCISRLEVLRTAFGYDPKLGVERKSKEGVVERLR